MMEGRNTAGQMMWMWKCRVLGLQSEHGQRVVRGSESISGTCMARCTSRRCVYRIWRAYRGCGSSLRIPVYGKREHIPSAFVYSTYPSFRLKSRPCPIWGCARAGHSRCTRQETSPACPDLPSSRNISSNKASSSIHGRTSGRSRRRHRPHHRRQVRPALDRPDERDANHKNGVHQWARAERNGPSVEMSD